MTCTTDTTQNLCLIPGGEFVESTVHDTKLQGWGDSYDGPCVRLKQRDVTAEIIIPATEWASLLRVLIKRQTALIKKLQAGHRATAERRLFELETELTNIENSFK